MLSLDNIICPHMQVAKRFLQTCSQGTTKFLGSTSSNFKEYSQDFLGYFSSEHKPLFIPIGLYFIKRHV